MALLFRGVWVLGLHELVGQPANLEKKLFLQYSSFANEEIIILERKTCRR